MKTLRDLFRDYRFTVSFIVLVIIVILAFLTIFSPYDPTLWDSVPKNMRPSAAHILGTDSNGQDIFWQATFAVGQFLSGMIVTFLGEHVGGLLPAFIALGVANFVAAGLAALGQLRQRIGFAARA